MIRISGLSTLAAVIAKQKSMIDTLADSHVKVGHLKVSEHEAMVSKVLENRWRGKGPEHWKTGEQYVTWAFAFRTSKELEKKLPDQIAQWLDEGVQGEEFWTRVGEFAVQTMKKKMRRVVHPPNADSTVRRKGFDQPLIAEGSKSGYPELGLPDKISYSIEEGDRIEESSATEAWESMELG